MFKDKEVARRLVTLKEVSIKGSKPIIVEKYRRKVPDAAKESLEEEPKMRQDYFPIQSRYLSTSAPATIRGNGYCEGVLFFEAQKVVFKSLNTKTIQGLQK